MKHIINKYLFIFVLLPIASFSQGKDETIKWLKSKLEKPGAVKGEYIDTKMSNFKIVDYKECKLIVTFKEIYTSIPSCDLEAHIPLNSIQYYDGDFPRLEINYDGIKYINKTTNKIFYNRIFYIKIIKTEENLIERIFKAFNHLNSMCVKQEEKF